MATENTETGPDPMRAADGVLTLGFIPLVDCAPLVVAVEKGFAAREGLRLRLRRETSWANIRDLVALGHLDAAQMLAPMPIAATLGIGRPADPTVAPLSLGLGGNAITLATDLFAAMAATAQGQSPEFARFDPAAVGRALATVLAERRSTGQEPPWLAVVHPFSGHNYEMRYWLAACGIDPDRDVRLTVLPPSRMVEAMRERRIEGFCAGEPWNSIAVAAGLGVMAITKSALWRQGPEKVLGLRTAFVERHPEPVMALIRALVAAAAWAGDPTNQDDLADLLANPAILDVPQAVLHRALTGQMQRRVGQAPEAVADFLVFSRHAATFPWVSHAQWFYAQMVRWGQVTHSSAHAEAVRGVYRPDLYRAALRETSTDLPRASAKVEGALRHTTPVASRFGTMLLGPDGFFDGQMFDPDQLEHYIGAFPAVPRNSAE
ncbi:CmpA/NrtA family ABC transporter substrate-binding protein [Lichenihabitans sp. Uapishka_5]|uniref:CmpA/NrtA family ABC transporter substrate-binding protein n=1 Tax=Lichenihabitans sp. Uapishka_5 TaxID=3037302 RepID=UPI0029E7E4C2|nr:CmpA/NrtA family ABC transporter substrate-binding protein [Lichenihabitans sp. Uapishka_5]MDX7949821.1 CmpA/NrtA family ABC transporter substrate-binding protein [Lichenihabitans sp. Uapishka_5]